MKKVLAAVLAAAMSLSMASVAMAVDTITPSAGSGTSLVDDYDYNIKKALDQLDNKSEIVVPDSFRIYTYDDSEVKFWLPVSDKDVKVRADVNEGKISVTAKRLGFDTNDDKVDDYFGYAVTVKAKWDYTNKANDNKWTVELDVRDNKSSDNPTVFLKGKGGYSDTQVVYSGDRLTVSPSDHWDTDGTSGAIFDFTEKLEDSTRIRCLPGVDLVFKGNYDTKKENLRVSTDTIDEVEEFFDDIDVDYFDFIASPKFASNVTVYINADKGTVPYTYNKDTGDLDLFEDAKYDDEANAWKFTTKKLGTYIFAEEEYEGGNVKDEPTKEPVSEPTETPADKNNPGTGANDMVGAAAALAVVSLIAAGAVAFKKASK